MSFETIIVKAKKDIIEKSRKIMMGEVGKKEITNKNDGEHIKKYMFSVGLGYPKGYPYCAAGQYWCFFAVNNSRENVPILASGSANGIYDYAKKKGKRDLTDFPNPQVDDLIVWIKKGAYSGHIERIIEVQDNFTVITVGFNTGSGDKGSQRDGGGVYKRVRYLNKPLGNMVVRGLIHFDTEE
jgi:hypothetical protein